MEANIARCPDAAMAEKMIARIDEIRKTGNSVGGESLTVAVTVDVATERTDGQTDGKKSRGMHALARSCGVAWRAMHD